MNQKQYKNEEKIFHAIQELKDSIFGLRQPYIRYCFSNTEEEGYVFQEEKACEFARQLGKCARSTRTYCEELEPVIELFFRVTLRLLAAICSSGDWVFVSFRKIAKTALKDTPDEESTLERIVRREKKHIDRMFAEEEFYPEYEEFCSYMGRVDAEGFYLCVKHGVENFLDDNHLNALDRDRVTDSVVAKISRLSASVERDLLRADWEDEE